MAAPAAPAPASRVPHPLPGWCATPLPIPCIPDDIKSADTAKDLSDEIYNQVVQRHRIMETYSGVDSTFALQLIRTMCNQAIEEFRKGKLRTSMTEWLGLVSSITHLESHAIDDPIRLACESVVLSMYCRFVKHERWVSTPAQFLQDNNYFEKERSHWWRKQKAAETAEHVRDKYDKLMSDLPAMLNFYNALLHVTELIAKPTLKHTVMLSALTAEGRSYENGQGRSIASECRHLLVRRECELPIKPRPQRQGDKQSGFDGTKSKSKKRKLSKHQHDDEGDDNLTDEIAAKSMKPLLALLDLGSRQATCPPPVVNRLTSGDWPQQLGLDRKEVPTVLEKEKDVFSHTVETSALLLLSSSASGSSLSVSE